ncbi:MAG: hypothetical protein ACI89T_000835 [Cognaticolwellia sp.]|jgi:hypothetical protein
MKNVTPEYEFFQNLYDFTFRTYYKSTVKLDLNQQNIVVAAIFLK